MRPKDEGDSFSFCSCLGCVPWEVVGTQGDWTELAQVLGFEPKVVGHRCPGVTISVTLLIFSICLSVSSWGQAKAW